jgi:CHAD domain-containing protein
VKLDTRLLDLPATEGAREIVTALLREAEKEAGRLEAGGGDEALHDFRVALRRLRSVARALRPQLGPSLPRKQERRLRDVARATAAARDAEVQAAWVATERQGASASELLGMEWLASRIEARRREGCERGLARAAARLRRTSRKLARPLSGAKGESPVADGPSFGTVLAGLLRSHLAELVDALSALGGPLDVEPNHAARITGKHLRYLLEPLRGNRRANARVAVTVLKELQDILGEMHDAHVALEMVASALIEAATERARAAHETVVTGDAGPRQGARDRLARGLLFLDRRAVERARSAHERLVREWIPERKLALSESVALVAERLARARPRQVRPRPIDPSRSRATVRRTREG